MKKRKILTGLGLLALPVVLLCIVFQKQLAHTWKEVVSLTSNNPHEYRSRTLKRPVTFTNQMFLSPEDYAARNNAPNGEYIRTGSNVKASVISVGIRPFLPYSLQLELHVSCSVETEPVAWPTLAWPRVQLKIEYYVLLFDQRERGWCGTEYFENQKLAIQRENIPEHLKNYFPEWPAAKPMEIEFNTKLKSTIHNDVITLTNTGKEPVQLSKGAYHSVMYFIIDENGGMWFIDQLDDPSWIQFRSETSIPLGTLLNMSQRIRTVRKERKKEVVREPGDDTTGPTESTPLNVIEPLASYEFPLPTVARPDKAKENLKCSLFFVILGENDKIIHIFETPCEK